MKQIKKTEKALIVMFILRLCDIITTTIGVYCLEGIVETNLLFRNMQPSLHIGMMLILSTIPLLIMLKADVLDKYKYFFYFVIILDMFFLIVVLINLSSICLYFYYLNL